MARQDRDNPIDWSAFDERASAGARVRGGLPLRVLSALMLVASIVGVVVLCMRLNSAMGAAAGSTDAISELLESGELWQSAAAIAVCALTIVPACLGLQASSHRPNIASLLAFGVLGVVAPFVLSAASAAFVAADDPGIPWLLLEVPAVLYLAFGVLVAVRSRHAAAHGSRGFRKEELWDDSQIWK